MISLLQIRQIQEKLIEIFGGAHGIRDLPALESALVRPFQTFDGIQLYPTDIEKAAALVESLLINHPFIDGNKRTAYTVTRIYLLGNGLDIFATQSEKYDFIINAASGAYSYELIRNWLNEHVKTST